MNADSIVLASYTRKQTGDFDIGITAKCLQSQRAVFTSTPAEYDAQCLSSFLFATIAHQYRNQDINPDAACENYPPESKGS